MEKQAVFGDNLEILRDHVGDETVIYLDNNATTALLPEVHGAIQEALLIGPSNPSSAHQAGDAARHVLSIAREAVAELIGASTEHIFFTSSGTEANNWVLHALTRKRPSKVVITPIEHESIRQKAGFLKAEGVTVHEIPVDDNGLVLLDAADKLVTPDTSLVSIQWVNNETGTIQPISDIAAICRSRGVLFHTDAAQAVGKLQIAVTDIPIDYMTFSGHKFHAPKGIGVTYRRPGTPLSPMLGGGTQESGLRPGTENLLGIAGIGKAAALRRCRMPNICTRLAHLRDRFENAILARCQGVVVNSGNAGRVCNTSNLRFPGVDGQAFMARLNNRGIYCSQSSACTSQIPEPSHVLLAMGLTAEQAFESIRFSFSEQNVPEEVDEAVQVITGTYSELKGLMVARSPA